MNMHVENWGNQESDRNDLESNSNSSSSNGSDAFNSNAGGDDEPEEDDLTEDDDKFDDDLTDDEEIPEQSESDDAGTGYNSQSEIDSPQRGADTSYSEQTDVTPPNPHEFPSTGPSKTDFASRPQGRTTGRMVGHEPGTEGI